MPHSSPKIYALRNVIQVPDSNTVQREPSRALSQNLLPGEKAALSRTGTGKEFIPSSLQLLTPLKIHSF